ncbi:hypothetical protein NCCP2140_38160 [Pseudoalteromonas sp. NCCP-2140]|uniref:hypothetical protein n=1 Tax=Pseudoalteromonas sp. NCCP-2140 TaxID=2942288 RepID=UPI00203C597E|nr:hypothetical protein [Pseudoalteromonas sp. NCCP-2140]GKW54763.1 hypothetical protein NCCP2140_38160 [Pseudoalteromonas sp. NCCP-2140]
MLIINEISSKIYVRNSLEPYGFRYELKKGLNIIKGQNSTGKSSVLSCIYYNLGMEQLLGMGSKNSLLDKCITSEFTIADKSFNIIESIITLTIENEKGDVAKLERIAYSEENRSKNRISITENDKVQDYFLHSVSDHDHQKGFYRWLENFINISLPTEKETGKHTIYLQNLFSACFVEQTKGWSDFFSQMPSFNIKDPKRKLVEYLLQLECLENDLEKDKLTTKKNILIEQWGNRVEKFERFDFQLSYKIDGLTKKYFKMGVNAPKKIQLKINNDGAWEDIKKIFENKRKELTSLKNENRSSEKRKDLDKLNTKRKELKLRLLKLNRIKSTLEREYTSEKVKLDSYKSYLAKLKEERQNIVGAKKVDSVVQELAAADSCPLCDTTLRIDISSHNITDAHFENSINFIDSKISMVNSYLTSSADFEEDFIKEKNYYSNLIFEIKTQLNSIDRDLNSNALLVNSREKIYSEIILSTEVKRLESLMLEFDKFKEDMFLINKNILDISSEIKDINTTFKSDKIKLESFQKQFRNYLTKFHYTSNDIYKVNIKDKDPYKAMPSIFNSTTKTDQPIRLASSASDFIRSEWAFYLSLLNISQTHPGLIIFDEPGQHAMSLDSMRMLLDSSSSKAFSNKQIILAISKLNKGYGKGEKENTFTLEELTSDLNNINEIDIDIDKEKLVKKFKIDNF